MVFPRLHNSGEGTAANVPKCLDIDLEKCRKPTDSSKFDTIPLLFFHSWRRP